MAIETVNVDNKLLISVDISAWSGKAKLTRADLSDTVQAELPPEKLARLGQKTLVDPALLQPFNMLRTSVYSHLSNCGVRMLGGWMISEQALPDLSFYLNSAATEYMQHVADFLNTYQNAALEWANQYPEWRDALLMSLPDPQTMQRKFSFSFHAYRLEAMSTGATYDDAQEQLDQVGTTAFGQLAEELKSICDQSFGHSRTKFDARVFKPLDRLVERARALSFSDPQMDTFAEFLKRTLDKYRGSCKYPEEMKELGLILKALSDPSTLAQIARTTIRVDTDPESLIAGVAGAPMPESEPEPEPEPAPIYDASAEHVPDTQVAQPEPELAQPAEPEPVQPQSESSLDSATQDLLSSLGF